MNAQGTNLLSGRALEIAEFAEFVADEHFPMSKIEPLRIIEKNQITYSFGKYGNAFDGLLEFNHKRFHIFLNRERLEELERPRARFTMATNWATFILTNTETH